MFYRVLGVYMDGAESESFLLRRAKAHHNDATFLRLCRRTLVLVVRLGRRLSFDFWGGFWCVKLNGHWAP